MLVHIWVTEEVSKSAVVILKQRSSLPPSLVLSVLFLFWLFFCQQSAVLKGKARPKSWGPGEIRKALQKQGSVDVAFKEKHQNYEKLQRQATTV